MSYANRPCPRCGATASASDSVCGTCGALLLDPDPGPAEPEPTGDDYDPVEEADRLDNPPRPPRRRGGPPPP